jgi:hypothetical protein
MNLFHFKEFYKEVFLQEHKHAYNIALHCLGTILGLAWIVFIILNLPLILLILFPIIHALPGLIGHRIFERNEVVGDFRFTRKDYPNYFFIIANHLLLLEVLTGKLLKRSKT